MAAADTRAEPRHLSGAEASCKKPSAPRCGVEGTVAAGPVSRILYPAFAG
jgi:hypothetical protein